jgi:hypothetical protein
MIKNVGLIPFCLFFTIMMGGACTSQGKPGTLTQFRQAPWPRVEETKSYQDDGKVIVSRRETYFSGKDKLIWVTRKDGELNAETCTMILTEFEDHLGYECNGNDRAFRSVNTLGSDGRILSATYDDPKSKDAADFGRYEYFGNNTVFYAYRKGLLLFTGLVEKSPGREKYTTWHNFPEPSIHVRDYADSGAGSETYIAASISFTETSKTSAYTFEDQKITVTFEKSRKFPDGILYMTHTFWDIPKKMRVERDYEISEPKSDLSDIPDFDVAKQLISRARITRESKSYALKI